MLENNSKNYQIEGKKGSIKACNQCIRMESKQRYAILGLCYDVFYQSVLRLFMMQYSLERVLELAEGKNWRESDFYYVFTNDIFYQKLTFKIFAKKLSLSEKQIPLR